MIKKCPNCGTEFNGIFCPECGTKVETIGEGGNEVVSKSSVDLQQHSSIEPKAQTEEKQSRKKGKKKIWPIAVIALAILAVAAIFLLTRSSDEDKQENSYASSADMNERDPAQDDYEQDSELTGDLSGKETVSNENQVLQSELGGYYTSPNAMPMHFMKLSIDSAPQGSVIGEFQINIPASGLEYTGNVKYVDNGSYLFDFFDDGHVATVQAEKETDGSIVLHYSYDDGFECEFVKEPDTSAEDNPEASLTDSTADLVSVLNSLDYYGDPYQSAMTPDMASAFLDALRNTDAPIVKAAIFDGGNGIPMMWIAHSNGLDSSGALTENYGDCIYRIENGTAVECRWITSLLREGSYGVVAQSSVSKYSDFANNFKLYYLENGDIMPEPFAIGVYDPLNGSTLNGMPVSSSSDDEELDIYRMADPNVSILLKAESGLADMLFLTGNWNDGDDMEQALLSYLSADVY